MTTGSFPKLRPVADVGVLVEFGDKIDDATHVRVRAFDAGLQAQPFTGFTESVPAYTSVLVGYDRELVGLDEVQKSIATLLKTTSQPEPSSRVHNVFVCYEELLAPDLVTVAERTGLSIEAVIAAHLAGDYRVFMYGFAPGYAYLAGVPDTIQLPRKTEPLAAVPAGSVLIAGAQSLVTTLTMPSGWWIIGRSTTKILDADAAQPFLFDVGDRVCFRRIDMATWDHYVKELTERTQ